MKKNIHPQYNQKVKVRCACGNEFKSSSTNSELYVEICSNCHPFFTGKQKLVDTAKRVEKFQARAAKQKTEAGKRKGKKVKKAAQQKKRSDRVEVVEEKKNKTVMRKKEQ